MFCPAASARSPAAWIAGPSAIGSVNGMPSSIRSAPACGNALTMASEVSWSGSPAMTKVISAARPSSWSAAKRRSMRVVIALCFQMPRDRIEVLVAAAGEIDHHQVILRLLRRQIEHLGDGVRRFQRRNDAFELGEKLERVERLVVGGREKGDAADIVEPGVFGADAGIIETGRDRMRFVDLAVLVHQEIGAIAVQHARAGRRRSRRRAGRF